MLDPSVRRVLDGASIAHLDAAWEIIDQLSAKYAGVPGPRGQERVVAVIGPERQSAGVG
jgi:hypothetical protein